mgnify:CR=1 FL=1|jgi:AraC-like DNA-binding protein|tara:strand:+ start:128166 stop:129290 length:1125 start_codon:yes stop_codon:yes gene_type:complete
MPITFELIDILIFVGVCQGVFLALTMQRIVNTNKRANSILTVLIAISTFMLIGRFLMIRYFSEWVFYLGILFDVVIFLFGPLFYWYTRTFLYSEETEKPLAKAHFIPAVLFSIFVIVIYVTYTPTTYLEAYQQGVLTVPFQIILASAILVNLYYLFRSFKVLYAYKKEYKQAFSFQQNPIQYIAFFLVTIAVIIILWALSFLSGFFENRWLSFIDYDLVWAAIPCFIYIIGYFSLKQPELFRVPMKQKTANNKERLNTAEQQLLQEKLDSLMVNDKIFLQPHLTLSTVAEMLQTSTNNVSWLLNNVYETTFYDFVNRYRVEEFVQKVENNEHLRHTILALSLDVGFNSKSTFNKAFKLHKQDTPSNFIKKHHAA